MATATAAATAMAAAVRCAAPLSPAARSPPRSLAPPTCPLPAHLRAPRPQVGYLAQHALFAQVPTLRDDIETPAYCGAADAADAAAPAECEARSSPLASAWLGGKGTVSPLHNDPYHNLLAQVEGHKYVRLYAPRHTGALYPLPGDRCNASAVNLDAPDEGAFPRFGAAPYSHAVLRPGELLHIPRLHWHYVRSLSPAFSVSFMWGARMGLRRSTDASGDEFVADY